MADSDRESTPGEGENQEVAVTEVAQDSQNGQPGNQVEEASPQAQPQQQAPAPGFWSIVKTLLIRCIIIYAISSFFRRSPQPPAAPGDQPGAVSAPMAPSSNVFMKETVMDMYVYITEQEIFTDFNNKNALFWLEEELVYGDWEGGPDSDGSFTKDGQIPLSQKVINNGSIYIHAFFVRAGNSPNPSDTSYNKKFTIHRMKMLNKFKKRKFHNTVNLLTGETDAHPDLLRAENETATLEILNFWHPNLTINLIDDHTPWTPGAVPQPLDEYIDFLPGTNQYFPILYFNDYWNMNKDMMPINQTTPVLNISLTYSPMSLFKWQMYAAQGMRSRWYNSFLGEDFMEESDEDQDSLKITFLETNPYLLAITIIVSIVHSVFEFLAFKNDIQFWRNRKTMEGLSVRSVFYSVFQSLVVCLYVLDNETNFVIRVSVFIGLAIECWKITKVTDVKFDFENKFLGIFPKMSINDKSTYTQSNTRQYDVLAFKYLSWLLFPLLGGYAVYSIYYLEHKSWYSWVLNMVYGFLLTFGFIMMTPQLFINYKLKSVAHLPWRMLTYKALNTFIDDLFAFVIKMPTLYRLGCFRDDIVFLIYLYQRYIYRIDPKRVNEYGTSAEMLEELEAEKNGHVVKDSGDNAGDTPAITDSASGAEEKKTKSPKRKSKKQKKTD